MPTDLGRRRPLLGEIDDDAILFNPLNDELFSCGEDVNEFHIAYARAHPELFSRIRGRPAD